MRGHDLTTIMIGMQDSILVHESSNKLTIHECLKGTRPQSGEFYAVNNHGIFISTDSGVSWERLDIPWPKEYFSQGPRALAVIPR